MKKMGHLFISRYVDCSSLRHHFWISLGSIIPDVMFWTIIKGHTIDAAGNEIFDKMRYLDLTGGWDFKSCVRAGIILHYVEDFFTTPHNSFYRGSVGEHLSYERAQFSKLKKRVSKKGFLDAQPFYQDKKQKYGRDAASLIAWVKDCHADYLQKDPGMEEDNQYIMQVASQIMQYYSYVFHRKAVLDCLQNRSRQGEPLLQDTSSMMHPII